MYPHGKMTGRPPDDDCDPSRAETAAGRNRGYFELAAAASGKVGAVILQNHGALIMACAM